MAESDSVVYTTTGPSSTTTSPSVGMDTPQQRYLLRGNRQLTERAMESTGLPGLLYYRSSCRSSNVERPVSDIGNTAGSVDARVDDDFIINNLPTASTTTKIRPTGQIPISPPGVGQGQVVNGNGGSVLYSPTPMRTGNILSVSVSTTGQQFADTSQYSRCSNSEQTGEGIVGLTHRRRKWGARGALTSPPPNNPMALV